MAKYNTFGDVKDTTEFKEFVKNQFNIDDISTISDTDRSGMLYMFKCHINDLTDNDIDYIDYTTEYHLGSNNEKLQALAKERFGKKLADLKMEEQIFVKAVAVEQERSNNKGRYLETVRATWEKWSPEQRKEMLAKKRRREELSELSNLPQFNNTQEMIDAFYKLLEVKDGADKYSIKDDVSDDILTTFIMRRDEYVAAHEDQRDEVKKQTEDVLDETSKKRLQDLGGVEVQYETVPNLVNVVTEHGFNDAEVMKTLQNKVKSGKLSPRAQEMYEAVIAAYEGVHGEKGKEKTYHAGVEKLNDLIVTKEDAKIAEDIARDFGYESNKEWPEMKKRLEEKRPIPTPQYTTVLQDETVPNLVNIVTEHGFNDAEVMKTLQNKVNSGQLSPRAQEMYEAVIAAYESVHGEKGKEKTYHANVEKLNDLIVTKEDAKIAEDIARDFGYESNKEWPEMKKRLEVKRPIPAPQYTTVLQDETVPNLVNVVTEYGFHDEAKREQLEQRLKDGKDLDGEDLSPRAREMYEAVLAAYKVSTIKNEKGEDVPYHAGVEKLNDLIETPEDVKIAEKIAREFGYESNKEWPEMKKKIKVQVIVVPPTNGGNGGDDGNDGGEGGGSGGTGGGDGNDGGEGGGGTGGGEQEFEEIRREIRIRSHDNYDNSTLMYQVELDILSDMREEARDGKEKSEEDKQLDADFAKAKDILARAIRERDLLRGLPEGEEPVQTVTAEDMAWARDFVEITRDKQIAEKDVEAYKFRLADTVFAKIDPSRTEQPDRRYYTLMTPELTATAIEGYEQQLKKLENAEPGSEEEKHKVEIKRRHDAVLEYGNALISWLKDKKEFYLTDITNAADEYDGYMHLINVCEKDDLAKKQQKANEDGTKEEVKADPSYQTARDMMEDYIKPYDEAFHIPSGKNPKDTAIDLAKRMRGATKICDNLEFNEDTLGRDYLEAMRNFRFIEGYNPDGTAKYEECVKTNTETGKLEVVEGSSLDTALRFAANEAMIEDLGDFKTKLTEDHLMQGAKDRAFMTLFAFANSEEVVKQGLKEDPKKFTDPRFVEDFKQKLMNGEKVEISPLAYDLALKRQANNVETYTNRLVNKLGRANADYMKAGLIRQVQKIDKTSNVVRDNVEYVKKKATRRNFGSAFLTFGVSVAAGVVITGAYLGYQALASKFGWWMPKAAAAATKGLAGTFKAGGVKGVALAAKAELAIGGISAAMGAVAGGAVATLGYLGIKKLQAKKHGQKYGFKEIKEDMKSSTFWATVGAGALGGASVGFALSGCPICATMCGLGSMGVAGTVRGIRSYKDMRVSGHNVLNSTLMGGVNFAAPIAGGYIGREIATTIAGWLGFKPHMVQTATEDETKKLYGKNGENLEQAKKDGWNFETSNQPKKGFTEIASSTSKNGPYHDYTADEMGWSVKRNDGIRWSEFLNGGKGGYHVQPDYQNGLGGLNHDAALHKNAIDVLDSLAGQKGNEWMNTLVNGNKAVPNSEMLLYKVYQMRVLAPNEGAMLADGSGTVSDFFNVDKHHTITTLYEKLLAGKTLDPTDLSVLSKIEDHVGGQITFDNTGKIILNDMGKIRDVVGATHPNPTPVDSYNDTADKGYDLDWKEITTKLFGRATRVVDHVVGFCAMFAEVPNRIKKFLRPGAKADRDAVVVDRKPKETVITTPPVDDNPKKKKKYDTPKIEVQDNQALIDEYKLVHGMEGKSMEVLPKSLVMYKDLVINEWKAEHEAGTTKTENLNDYLKERRERFDAAVALAKAPALEDTKGYSSTKDGLEATNHVRNEMSLTNLAYQGKELPVEKITLKQMTEFTPYSLSNGAGHAEVTAARRSHDAPLPKGKSDKPMDGIFDIATGKTSGAKKVTTPAGKGVNDGPQAIKRERNGGR